jgi:hypothetical protein
MIPPPCKLPISFALTPGVPGREIEGEIMLGLEGWLELLTELE